MAARKKVSKKSAKRTSKKKTVRKKKVASKKASRKKASKKKVTRKKTSRKKPAKKKASKKKTSKKKPKKKVAKKKTSKKKVSKKKASKKKASKKKAKKKSAKKKTTKKKVSKKKASKKKKSSTKKKPTSRKKKVSKKKTTSVKKKPTKKAPASKKKTKAAAEQPETKTVKKVVVKSPAKRFVAHSTVAQPMNPADHVPRRPKRRKKVNSDQLIHGIDPYVAKAGEEYMNDAQLAHFREILNAWKRELMEEVDRTVHHMQDEASNFPDPNDRATQESEFSLELRTRDRERKLLKKIEQALNRIDEGEYGYCEETGEEIGLKRLEARPVATLCVEAQERREVAERQYRDSDDRYR